MSSIDDFSGKSNTRPIAIFSSYILLCFSLTVLILRSLYLSSKRPSSAQNKRPGRAFLFAALATVSLGTTWYYMFCFFAHSYRQWESTSSIHLTEDEILANLQLGPWLNDTKLFKEAWGTALETPARFWWTQQIFFFTSIWSVFLGQQGFARHIPHLWAYMLLGQVVAISFATNLFFLGTSLSPVSSSTSLRIQERWTLSTATLLIPLLATFISTGLIPSSVTKPYFMYLLLLPHVALFIPPILYSVPQSWGTIHPSAEAAQRFYERVYSLLVMLSIVLICLASNVTWNSIEGALYEHPAVSSVGWDVILCWISWGTWIFVHQVDRSDDRKARQGKQR